MSTILDDGLCVELCKNFYSAEECEKIFAELILLEFHPLTLKINNRVYTPNRKVYGFGDSGVCYDFSGTSVSGNAWTPTLKLMKEVVEDKVGAKFNFALVNLYVDGSSKIAPHHDNEKSLLMEIPIPTVSFGASRHMIFDRIGYTSHHVLLESGSLIIMHPPTNGYWKHSIPNEPQISAPRISVTFRNITMQGVKRPFKSEEYEIPDEDWMSIYVKEQASYERTSKCTIIQSWNLGCGIVLSVHVYENRISIHIREYVNRGERQYPTTRGVCLSTATWRDFSKKIFSFNTVYRDSSQMCNNRLLIISDGGECILKELEKTATNYNLKSTILKISCEGVKTLQENVCEITTSIYNCLFNKILRDEIINSNKNTILSHQEDKDVMYDELIECIKVELRRCVDQIHYCDGCLVNHCSQRRHSCMMLSAKERIMLVGEEIFLVLCVKNVVKMLIEKNIIHKFDANFFEGCTYENFKNSLMSM